MPPTHQFSMLQLGKITMRFYMLLYVSVRTFAFFLVSSLRFLAVCCWFFCIFSVFCLYVVLRFLSYFFDFLFFFSSLLFCSACFFVFPCVSLSVFVCVCLCVCVCVCVCLCVCVRAWRRRWNYFWCTLFYDFWKTINFHRLTSTTTRVRVQINPPRNLFSDLTISHAFIIHFELFCNWRGDGHISSVALAK